MSKYLLTIGKGITVEYPTKVSIEGGEEFKELAFKLAYTIQKNEFLLEAVQTLLKEDLDKYTSGTTCESKEEYERKVKEYNELPDYVKRAMKGEPNERAKQ
jgi:hypothetical protein